MKLDDSVTFPLISLHNRVKQILKDTVFCFVLQERVRLEKSGHPEDDKIRLAIAMFNKMKISHPRLSVGKPFRFFKCSDISHEYSKI